MTIIPFGGICLIKGVRTVARFKEIFSSVWEWVFAIIKILFVMAATCGVVYAALYTIASVLE